MSRWWQIGCHGITATSFPQMSFGYKWDTSNASNPTKYPLRRRQVSKPINQFQSPSIHARFLIGIWITVLHNLDAILATLSQWDWDWHSAFQAAASKCFSIVILRPIFRGASNRKWLSRWKFSGVMRLLIRGGLYSRATSVRKIR